MLNPFSKPVKKSTSGAQVLEDDDEDLYNMNDVLPQQVRSKCVCCLSVLIGEKRMNERNTLLRKHRCVPPSLPPSLYRFPSTRYSSRSPHLVYLYVLPLILYAVTRSKLKDDSGEMYELEEVKKSDNAAAMWALMNADDNDMKLKRKAESSKDELANLMKQKKKKQKTTDGKAKAKAKAKKGKKGDKKKKKKKVLNSWELPDQGSSLQDLFKKKKAEDKVEEKTEKVTEGSSLPSSSPSSSPVADSTTGAVKPTFGVTEVTGKCTRTDTQGSMCMCVCASSVCDCVCTRAALFPHCIVRNTVHICRRLYHAQGTAK